MEEMLDTYDIHGNFMGVKPRSFCDGANAGVYHKPVGVWIINSKGQILLQKRSMRKKTNAGKWDMPVAGHVAAGEKAVDCCVRESKEELGIIAKAEDFIFLKEVLNQSGWELLQIYLLKLDANIEVMTLQEEEVDEVKWMNFDEFEKLIHSDDFCDYDLYYKDWACEVLKEYLC